MLIGVLYAGLAAACGLAVNRALRLPLSLAPISGLAAVAVATSWCVALRAPPLMSTALVLALALSGVAVGLAMAPRAFTAAKKWPVLLMLAAMAIPALMLGSIFAGVG